MSKKYGNSSATFNIPLNNSESDIFRIGCAHLQHFININVKMDDCKPMMLKMHLELDDFSPSSIGEAEKQQNIVDNNSINGLRQSVQQLEEEMKVLKDALLQAMDDVVNRIDKAPDDDSSNKQANNENKISSEQHNDIDSVAKATTDGHQRNAMPKEKPEVFDLRDNCVYIENFQCSDSSLEKAFHNVHKLANEMNAEIPNDSVIHIDVEEQYDNYLDYYVYFCDEDIKEEFLKNRHFYVYHPETSPLRIIDYSNWGIINIMNVESSDRSLETAYANVMEIAEKMGIMEDGNLRTSIEHIDVYPHSRESNFLTYSVQFNNNYLKNDFLKQREKLKDFQNTKHLEILDVSGHSSFFWNVKNFSMTVAGANVIGLAELIGLSLATDNLKRIYVLNYLPQISESLGFYFIVEFSNKQVKAEFLHKKDKLDELDYYKYDYVTISDINARKRTNCTVSIEYIHDQVAAGISFIGLAKQLGFSLTPDQIQLFFDLSNFMYDAKRCE